MKKDSPLVSIIVVSYNAATTVTDTLNSVLEQNYKNIELVISDDCSADSTVEIVNKWLEDNGQRFDISPIFLKTDKNQGVCKNLNKAVTNSSGTWIKTIAADDKLLPNCCLDFVNYILNNRNANFVASYVKVYNETFDEANLVRAGEENIIPPFFNEDVHSQLRRMAYYNQVQAPSIFFSRSLYDSVGGFDERYVYEDHPFYVSILEAGEKLFFLPKATVAYRIHQSTYNSQKKLFNYQFSRSSKQFRQERCYKYYGSRQRIAVKAYYGILTLLEKLHLNKKNKVSHFFYHVLTGLIWKIGK